ncbi:hypothetical protein CRYUN_Cryun19dG0064400 [Craigia yunnanensis]
MSLQNLILKIFVGITYQKKQRCSWHHLENCWEATNFAFAGGAIGVISTAGFAWKYSRSLHGAGLCFVEGAVFGWTFGQEIANHWYQLYRLDTMAAQVKFLEWWENKCQRS